MKHVPLRLIGTVIRELKGADDVRHRFLPKSARASNTSSDPLLLPFEMAHDVFVLAADQREELGCLIWCILAEEPPADSFERQDRVGFVENGKIDLFHSWNLITQRGVEIQEIRRRKLPTEKHGDVQIGSRLDDTIDRRAEQCGRRNARIATQKSNEPVRSTHTLFRA